MIIGGTTESELKWLETDLDTVEFFTNSQRYQNGNAVNFVLAMSSEIDYTNRIDNLEI